MTVDPASSEKSAYASRLDARFKALKAKKQSGLVTFITAGDPDLATSAQMLEGLAKAGADIIELGMPFSDPMADGPAIQMANMRAFKAGITLKKTLHMVRQFRAKDKDTPLVLMGYFNPVYAYGVEKFLDDARNAGVDGLIIVDLPPEEDAEICAPAQKKGIPFIRLVTPTTNEARLTAVLHNASGFLYYVSMTGITGSKAVKTAPVETAINTLRKHTSLPVAVGFGITTPEEAGALAQFADAVVVGSAIVKRVECNLDAQGKPKSGLVNEVLGFVETLAKAVHNR